MVINYLFIMCLMGLNKRVDIGSFYPLNVGNKWVYCGKGDTSKVDIDSIVIIDTVIWKGQKCYKQDWLCLGDEPTYKYHICYNGELREYDTSPSDSTPYGVLLKEPLKVGNTWEFPVDSDTLLYKIEDKKATLKVPAGTFHNCLKLSRKTRKEPLYNGVFWFAPKVGMIKCTFSGLDVDIELLRYEVK